MTQDEILQMALKAGAKTPRLIWPPTFTKSIDFTLEGLEAFAKLIEQSAADKEREACAKVCESYVSENPYSWGGTTISAAIRARGQA